MLQNLMKTPPISRRTPLSSSFDPSAQDEPSRFKALSKMFAFALAVPNAVGSRFPNRAVCKKRSTVMVAADVSSRAAKQKLDSVANEAENVASKSKSYQSKEYTPEEIDQLKKKRALMFMNRKYTQGT